MVHLLVNYGYRFHMTKYEILCSACMMMNSKIRWPWDKKADQMKVEMVSRRHLRLLGLHPPRLLWSIRPNVDPISLGP